MAILILIEVVAADREKTLEILRNAQDLSMQITREALNIFDYSGMHQLECVF